MAHDPRKLTADDMSALAALGSMFASVENAGAKTRKQAVVQIQKVLKVEQGGASIPPIVYDVTLEMGRKANVKLDLSEITRSGKQKQLFATDDVAASDYKSLIQETAQQCLDWGRAVKSKRS